MDLDARKPPRRRVMRQRGSVALVVAIVFAGAASSATLVPTASAGVDLAFGTVAIEPAGTNVSGSRAVLALADGSAIVASRIDGATWVQRYSPTGILDGSFGEVGTPGRVQLDAFEATAIRLDGSGRVLVLGSRTDIGSGPQRVVVRMTTAGIVDGGFAGDAQPYGFGMDAFVEIGSRLVFTGSTQSSGGRACLHAIRSSDGLPDPTFGNGTPGHTCLEGLGAVTAVAAVRHGDGTFTMYSFVRSADAALVTLVDARDVSADGATLSAPRVIDLLLGIVRSVTVGADGTVIAGGVSTDPTMGGVWRIVDEVVDADFGSTPLAMARLSGLPVDEVRVLPDGRVLALGTAASLAQVRLLTADGLPDGALDPGAPAPDRVSVPTGVHAGWTPNRARMADASLDPSGRVYLVGTESFEQAFATSDAAGFLTRSGEIGASVPIVPDAIGEIVPVTPERLFDTRPESRVQRGGGKPAPGETVEIGVVGFGTSQVPADAQAVVLNVTATDVSGEGFITVWPCGADRPLASNLNLRAGATRPNLVLVGVGAGGRVCAFTQGGTHLIVDVTGYVPITSSYTPIVPRRVLETRTDGQTGYVGAKPSAGQVIELQVTGATGLAPDGAEAVALNLTATEVDGDMFVTVWPCGTERPTTSSLNAVAGETTPVMVMAAVGAGGKVCLFTQRPVHLIADLSGWFPAGSSYTPLVPDRLLDTRPADPSAERDRSTGGRIRGRGTGHRRAPLGAVGRDHRGPLRRRCRPDRCRLSHGVALRHPAPDGVERQPGLRRSLEQPGDRGDRHERSGLRVHPTVGAPRGRSRGVPRPRVSCDASWGDASSIRSTIVR